MGGMALLFALAGSLLGVFSLNGLYNVVVRMWGGVAADPVLASIPMFIFMGSILERSGSAMDMLKATEVLLGGWRSVRTSRASCCGCQRWPASSTSEAAAGVVFEGP